MRKRIIAWVCTLTLLFASAGAANAAYAVGDVDGNGSVNAADAASLLRCTVKLETLSEDALQAADVDGNGKADAADAALILRWLVRLCNLDGSTPYQDPTPSPDATAAPTQTAEPSHTPLPSAGTQTGTLDIYLIDVGFGDCILLTSPHGKTMLVDASNLGTNDHGVAAKTQITELLSTLGITHFDLGVYSHAHSDHVNGFMGFLTTDYGYDAFAFPSVHSTGSSGTYSNITTYLQQQSALMNFTLYPVDTSSDATVFTSWDSDVQIDVLWPPAGYETSDPNETSLVLRLEYDGYSILLTGDITRDVESELLQLYDADTLDIDVLKIAHHTSNGSTSAEFLKATTPILAVASVTQYSYNWPGASTVSRLMDAHLYWSTTQRPTGGLYGTCYHGNIHVRIDEYGVMVETEYSYAG